MTIILITGQPSFAGHFQRDKILLKGESFTLCIFKFHRTGSTKHLHIISYSYSVAITGENFIHPTLDTYQSTSLLKNKLLNLSLINRNLF